MPDIQVDLAVHRPAVREHLLAVLQEAGDFRIRHVAESGRQAVRDVQTAPPDLLLLSTDLPDAPWQQMVQHILCTRPAVPIIAVSRCDAEHVARLLAQGLAGCIAEGGTAEEVVAVLRAVVEGDVRFSRRVLRELIQSHEPDAASPDLSDRQRQVLGLLAQGYDNQQIAETLCLSVGTVRNYVSRIYQCIGVVSRVEAARWAWQHGVAQTA